MHSFDGIPSTIPAALDRAVAQFAAAEALIDGERRLSWTQLGAAVHEAAAALHASGVGKGDRVAIWAPNIAEWVLVSLGAHYIGAVVVPVNTRFRGAEANHVLRAAGARILFTVTDFLQTDYVALLRAAAVPPSLERIVVLRGAVPDGTLSWSAFLSGGAKVPASAVYALSASVQPNSTSEIMFTSGTTGAPKGAMLTHGASTRAMLVLSEIIGLRAGDRYLIINPFFHVFGLKAGILSCTLMGATMIVESVFDVSTVLARVAAERVSVFPGPPTIYRTMLDHPDLRRHDTSSLRLALTGATTVPVELILRMRKELSFETIITAYGLTEATGLVTTCRRDDDPQIVATTAGRPIPDIEMRLVDERGRDVPLGEPGEIIVRGYNLMQGYFEDPESTAAAIDPEGYLHTGDIAVQEPNGCVRITDRKKDMFIVGGFNAYPAEIESIMRQHPQIGDVAVVGVPDLRLGEVGMAYVVPRHGARLDAADLHVWCRDRMANFKVPRRYAFVDALPLSATGKILKYRLREMALESA